MLADVLEQFQGSEEEEFNIKWTATSMYGGGADTTKSTMLNFFLCMTLFPEAQTMAQEEIEAVVGHDRLPTLADRPHLPYVEALFKEVLEHFDKPDYKLPIDGGPDGLRDEEKFWLVSHW